jgi:hypothetical protein
MGEPLHVGCGSTHVCFPRFQTLAGLARPPVTPRCGLAQSLRCSWAVLTARENETDTSGFTTVLKAGAAGIFAQFQLARRTHCMGSVTRQWNSPESLGGMSMRGAAGVGLPA